MGAKFFRVFDSINLCALRRNTRCRGRGGHRFFWSLDEIAPEIFAIFGLWQIASGYVENLGRTLFISS
jgi:hypothetical protein